MFIYIAYNHDHHMPSHLMHHLHKSLTPMHHNRIAGEISSSRAGSNRGSPAGGARIGGAVRGGRH
jgi:hypothetical protein